MSSYAHAIENLQTHMYPGPESSAWRGQSLIKVWPTWSCLWIYSELERWGIGRPADRLLIYLKFWSICRRSSGARWNLGIASISSSQDIPASRMLLVSSLAAPICAPLYGTTILSLSLFWLLILLISWWRYGLQRPWNSATIPRRAW